jgi:hypothetical protein
VIQITSSPIISWDDPFSNWSQELAMASIQEVQVAEKKVQAVLRELKKTDLTSRDDLHQQLAKATDEYVKAIADLKINSPDADCRKHA